MQVNQHSNEGSDNQVQPQLQASNKLEVQIEQPKQSIIRQSQPNNLAQIKKQQSLEVYLEITQIEINKDNQANGKGRKLMSNQQLPQLVHIEDSMQIPSLNLQPSPRSQKALKISITSYRNVTFMGMKTQIFIMRISDPNIQSSGCYEIQRRFSDFADLYEQIYYNEPGYILFPFPEKTLQSFIKLKLGIATQGNQTSQLIEKRISKLQLFINWVADHQELRNSQQFAIFKTKDEKQFQEGKSRLNKYVEEYRGLEVGSHFQNIVDIGKSMFNSYFKNAETMKGDRKMSEEVNKAIDEAQQYIKYTKQLYFKKLNQAQLLLKAQKHFSEFISIDSESDVLQQFCAQHDSSRQFCNKYAFFLEFSFIDKFSLECRKIEEAEKCLIHRKQILQIIKSSTDKDKDRRAKLQRLVQRLQRNFEIDWPNFKLQLEQKSKQLFDKFACEWEVFKLQMRKIWKLKKGKGE